MNADDSMSLKMRVLAVFAFALLLALPAAAQTGTKAPAKKTGTAARQATPARKAPAKAPTKAAEPKAAPGPNPTAVIHTSAGDLTCELFRDKVPGAVGNFVGLATGSKEWTDPRNGQQKHGVPLYDGTIFHRVIPNFMIQGGDPTGTGTGWPGYRIPDEFVPDLKFDKGGVLAYANSGPNTNGSQFFITEVEYPILDPCLDDAGCIRGNRQVRKGAGYTIFGQCTPESVELVKKIAREPSNPGNNRPESPVVIKHIDIQGLGKPAGAPGKRPAAGAASKTAPAKPKQ